MPKRSKSKAKPKKHNRARSRSKSRNKSSRIKLTSPAQKEKMHQVMHEFKVHQLKSHDEIVTDRPQAVAIGLHTASKIDTDY